MSLVNENAALMPESLSAEICRRLALLQSMTVEFDDGLLDVESHLAQMVVDYQDLLLENSRLRQQVRQIADKDYWAIADANEDRIRSLELQIGKAHEADWAGVWTGSTA